MIPDYLPLQHTEFKKVFEALKALPRLRECRCPHCQTIFPYITIMVHATCPSCQTTVKTRCFGGYEEIQDLIMLILDWLGPEDERKKILSEFDNIENSGNLTDWEDFFTDD